MGRKVIYVTDGDGAAVKAVAAATKKLGMHCLMLSGGNPTSHSYEELRTQIHESPAAVTVILFDDAGAAYEGKGEAMMVRLTQDDDVEVIGALAVASAERSGDWTHVHVSVDRYRNLEARGVDKEGFVDIENHRVHGDTVYTLDRLNIPLIVGIGDLGKMGGRDDVRKGSPVTQTALQLILERSGCL